MLYLITSCSAIKSNITGSNAYYFGNPRRYQQHAPILRSFPKVKQGMEDIIQHNKTSISYKNISVNTGVSGLSPLLRLHHLNPYFDLLHDSNTDGMHTPTNECKAAALYFIVGSKDNAKGGDNQTKEQKAKRIKARDSYVNVGMLRKKLRDFPVSQELKDGRFPVEDTITGALGFWKCTFVPFCTARTWNQN